jgi:hypothetical protein
VTSATDYCNKMKRMTDALGTLGEPVLDRTLVLNVLRGLNEPHTPVSVLLRLRADLLLTLLSITRVRLSSPT